MGLSGQEELNVEINSPGEFFFDVFGTKKALFPKICPNIIPRIDLLEGEWGTPGCTILVHYHLDGKSMISRETIVAVDVENKSISYKLLEGDIMKLFKTITMTVQPTQKSECNFFKWTIIYEKFVDEDIQAFFDAWKEFMNNVTKEIDAYYFQAQPQEEYYMMSPATHQARLLAFLEPFAESLQKTDVWLDAYSSCGEVKIWLQILYFKLTLLSASSSQHSFEDSLAHEGEEYWLTLTHLRTLVPAFNGFSFVLFSSINRAPFLLYRAYYEACNT
ncbi:hypothetical protein LguiB_026272 [Lonicera macranthoides]